MNNVSLIGRLARDPELAYTQGNNTPVCKFALAVDRPKRNGEDQGADFIKIIVWNKQAENCDRYLSKGSQIAVSGRITTGSYKNRDGQTVYTTEVTADRVEFLGSSRQNNQESQQSYTDCQSDARPVQKQSRQNEQVSMTDDDWPDTFSASNDDIPF